MSSNDIVVLLNANARKVGVRVKKSISELVPRVKIYYSQTLEDSSKYIREIVENRYPRVFSGGGDGSLANLITLIKKYVDEKNLELNRLSKTIGEKIPKYKYPDIGILKFGTGNGWAGIVGSKRGIRPLLALEKDNMWKLRKFNLLETEDRLVHFAGLGWDAAIINDYIQLKNRFKTSPMKQIMSGLTGYMSSLFLKTIPRELFRTKKIEARIVNQGKDAYYVDADNKMHRMEIGKGDIIYEGHINIIGAGVITDYGFGLKAFPFAGIKPDMMNLRIVKSGVIELVSHMRKIWVGKYRSSNFLDFIASKITIELDSPLPFQMAGDPMGYREQVTFQVSNHKVNVIDFSK